MTVYGRVQGVGFRYHTREKARSLNLTGYVTNKSDQTVEIVADGPAETLQVFMEWVNVGPDRARVERVDIEECLPINRFDHFVIEL